LDPGIPILDPTLKHRKKKQKRRMLPGDFENYYTLNSESNFVYTTTPKELLFRHASTASTVVIRNRATFWCFHNLVLVLISGLNHVKSTQ
jgi:hypothetical protein